MVEAQWIFSLLFSLPLFFFISPFGDGLRDALDQGGGGGMR